MPPTVKMCVFGSTGVGKSKLIQQFLYNFYDDQYEPTGGKGFIYQCSTMLNQNLYQLKIFDVPAIEEFPVDALNEWSGYQQCILRTAHAYIFVFDLNTPASFQYIKTLRDQLFENRNMQNIPVWIVGNKADLCLNVLATIRSHRSDHHHPQSQRLFTVSAHQHQTISPYEDIVPAFKEFANLVRKQWKCNYIECSAKYNWHVTPIFREVIKSVEPLIQIEPIHHHYSSCPKEPSMKTSTASPLNDASTSRSHYLINDPRVANENSNDSRRFCRIL